MEISKARSAAGGHDKSTSYATTEWDSRVNLVERYCEAQVMGMMSGLRQGKSRGPRRCQGDAAKGLGYAK